MVPVAKGAEEVAMGGEFYTENLNLSWNRRRRRWDGKEGGIVAAAAGRETGRWEGGGAALRGGAKAGAGGTSVAGPFPSLAIDTASPV